LIKLNELRENYSRAGKIVFTANTSLLTELGFSVPPIANRPINRVTLIPLTPSAFVNRLIFGDEESPYNFIAASVRWREARASFKESRGQPPPFVNAEVSRMKEKERDRYREKDRF